MSFRCPVCSQELKKEEKIWVCPQGHTFDIAAKGYVNLLMSNSSGAKRHGDDRLMINARRDFLSKGFYTPLREAFMRLFRRISREAVLCSTRAAASAGTLRILKAGSMNRDLSRKCSAWISQNTRSKKRRKTAELNVPWRAYISYPWATANAMR